MFQLQNNIVGKVEILQYRGLQLYTMYYKVIDI